MVLARRRVLPGTLVMMLVSLGRRRSRGGGGGSSGDIAIFTMPGAADLANPNQLRDQQERCNKATCATIEHEGV